MQRARYALGVIVCCIGLALLDVARAAARTPEVLPWATWLGALLVSSAALLTLAAPWLCARLWLVQKLPERVRPVIGGLDALLFGYIGFIREDVASISMSARVGMVVLLVLMGLVAAWLSSRVWRAMSALCVVGGLLAIVYAEGLPPRDKPSLRLVVDMFAIGSLAYGMATSFGRRLDRVSQARVPATLSVVCIFAGHLVLAHVEDVRGLIYDYAPHASSFLVPLQKWELQPQSDMPQYGIASCDPHAPRARRSKRHRKRPHLAGAARAGDVLMLSFDAMRFDAAESIPAVWKAMGPHVRFTRAVVPAPRTVNSLSAILRGVPARRIPFVSDAITGERVARGAPPTLAKMLVARGYRAVHVPTHRYFEGKKRVNAGFEIVRTDDFDDTTSRDHGAYDIVFADTALKKGIDVAKTTARPLLLWIHFMEGHQPYRWNGGRGPESKAGQLHAYRDLDASVASFIDEFRRVREGRQTVIAIFGDHGEEFGEHGGKFHSSSVYAEQSRAVFALRAPGMRDEKIDAPVSHASLPASVLELLGEKPSPTASEPSLLSCIDARAACPRVAVTQMIAFGRSISYTFARYRLVIDPIHKIERLYDSNADPFERNDISTRRPKVLAKVRKMALRFDRERCIARN